MLVKDALLRHLSALHPFKEVVGTIIVLSDIHGNLDALEAAWRDLRERPYDALYCLGDLAAFGPHPEECVHMLREVIRPTGTILGNTDRYILEKAWKGMPPAPPFMALKWAHDQLSKESLKWLGTLPARLETTLDGMDLEFVHAAPGNDELDLGPATPRETLDELFVDAGAGITFAGHTHIPWRGAVGKRQILNVGSVGFPYDGDHRASYLRLVVSEGELRDLDFRRTVFNTDAVIRELEARDVPYRETSIRRLRFAEAKFPQPNAPSQG